MLDSHSGRLERSCKPSALPASVRIRDPAPLLLANETCKVPERKMRQLGVVENKVGNIYIN